MSGSQNKYNYWFKNYNVMQITWQQEKVIHQYGEQKAKLLHRF